MKHPNESENFFRMGIVEAIVSSQKGHIDPLETSLVYRDSPDILIRKKGTM